MIFNNRLLKWFVPLFLTGFMFFPQSVFPQVDLKVTKVVVVPTNPCMKKDEATIRVLVKNIGDQVPSQKTSLSMAIWSVNSAGERISGKTSLPTFMPPYQNNISKLDPDHAISISRSYTFQHSGRHKIETVINTESLAFGEEQSQNNLYHQYFSVRAPRPDLVVCSLKEHSVPPHIKSGFRATVINIGDKISAPCDLRFWIEKKGIKHYTIPALVPEEKYEVKRSVYFAMKGWRRFSLRIDSRDQIVEDERDGEDNNFFQGKIHIHKYAPTQEVECSVVAP